MCFVFFCSWLFFFIQLICVILCFPPNLSFSWFLPFISLYFYLFSPLNNSFKFCIKLHFIRHSFLRFAFMYVNFVLFSIMFPFFLYHLYSFVFLLRTKKNIIYILYRLWCFLSVTNHPREVYTNLMEFHFVTKSWIVRAVYDNDHEERGAAVISLPIRIIAVGPPARLPSGCS